MKPFDLHEHAWRYFHVHASQRLTTFNFYIVMSSLMATGYFAAICAKGQAILGILLGALVTAFSCVFWKLDCRNRQLISHAEDALKHLESQCDVNGSDDTSLATHIFSREEAWTKQAKEAHGWRFWRNHYTYTNCFNAVFFIFGLFGVLAAVYAACAAWLS